MLRYSIYTVRKISQPKVLCSTSTPKKLEKPNPLMLKLMTEFEEISNSSIIEVLQHKEFNNIKFEEWKRRINVLKRHYFDDAKCFEMISVYPYLLKIPLENFENSVKQWYLADLGLKNFQSLLHSQPQLIETDVKNIRKRVPQLRVYFRTSEAMCNLLAVSPNVMFDNWESLVEKMHYVIKVRRFNMSDVINSQALSKPLNFIKFRLELLEKCGVYKQDKSPLHKLNKFDKTKYKNPSLKEILNPNSANFVKIAKISHEEYLMCESLYNENDDEDKDEDENLSDSYK